MSYKDMVGEQRNLTVDGGGAGSVMCLDQWMAKGGHQC